MHLEKNWSQPKSQFYCLSHASFGTPPFLYSLLCCLLACLLKNVYMLRNNILSRNSSLSECALANTSHFCPRWHTHTFAKYPPPSNKISVLFVNHDQYTIKYIQISIYNECLLHNNSHRRLTHTHTQLPLGATYTYRRNESTEGLGRELGTVDAHVM